MVLKHSRIFKNQRLKLSGSETNEVYFICFTTYLLELKKSANSPNPPRGLRQGCLQRASYTKWCHAAANKVSSSNAQTRVRWDSRLAAPNSKTRSILQLVPINRVLGRVKPGGEATTQNQDRTLTRAEVLSPPAKRGSQKRRSARERSSRRSSHTASQQKEAPSRAGRWLERDNKRCCRQLSPHAAEESRREERCSRRRTR